MNTSQPLERHPLGFFLPNPTKLLMLGSFPPPQNRWSMHFYYPNFQNDMRRILGIVFYHDKDYFITPSGKAFDEGKAKKFCIEKGMGIGDTAEEVIRLKGNASDDTLQVVKAFDLVSILSQLPECQTIVVTGQKAMDTLISVVEMAEPKVWFFSSCEVSWREIRVYRMPSSSRAYPKPLEEKAKRYEEMFHEVGLV